MTFSLEESFIESSDNELDSLSSSFIPFEEEKVKITEKKEEISPSPVTLYSQLFPPKTEIGRQIERGYARAGETILGLPGDLVQAVKGLGQGLVGLLGTQEVEERNIVQEKIGGLLEQFPTSSELRARSMEEAPELEPQSRQEEIMDEFVEDFSSLAIPVKGKIPFARSLGLATIGNLGKQTVKEIGFDEGTQDATKLGLMLFSGMFGKGRGVRNYIKNLYKESDKFIEKGASLQYPISKLDKFEKVLKKGSNIEAKQPSFRIVEELKSKIKNGSLDVREAIQFDKDINKEISRSFKDKTKAGYLKQLKKTNIQALDSYAKQNPSWGEAWNDAKQAYKGIETSLQVQNFIKRNANLKNLGYAALALGQGSSFLPGTVGTQLASAGLGGAGLYAAELSKRISTNKPLRKYYENVIKAAIDENKFALARNIEGLNRIAKKEFEDNPLGFIPQENIEE